jgi:hypothetical protein
MIDVVIAPAAMVIDVAASDALLTPPRVGTTVFFEHAILMHLHGRIPRQLLLARWPQVTIAPVRDANTGKTVLTMVAVSTGKTTWRACSACGSWGTWRGRLARPVVAERPRGGVGRPVRVVLPRCATAKRWWIRNDGRL